MDQRDGQRLGALVGQFADAAQPALALSQHQQIAAGAAAFEQVALPMAKLTALVGLDGAFADVAPVGNRPAPITSNPPARAATSLQPAILLPAGLPVPGDQPVKATLDDAHRQKSDVDGREAIPE